MAEVVCSISRIILLTYQLKEEPAEVLEALVYIMLKWKGPCCLCQVEVVGRYLSSVEGMFEECRATLFTLTLSFVSPLYLCKCMFHLRKFIGFVRLTL